MKALSWVLLLPSLLVLLLFLPLAIVGLSPEALPIPGDMSDTRYWLLYAAKFGTGMIGWLALFCLFTSVQRHPGKSPHPLIHAGLALGLFSLLQFGLPLGIFGIPPALLTLCLLLQHRRQKT